MNFTPSNPFYLKPLQVEHDRRLVRRYRWQSLLRAWAGMALLLMPVLAVLAYAGYGSHLRFQWQWGLTPVLLSVLMTPLSMGLGTVHRRLTELSDAGQALTAEMFSARPSRTLISPLDPLSTFDLCTEVLSGLTMGKALGCHGPAVFSHYAFEGRIVLGPWRPLWLGRSIEVRIDGDSVNKVKIQIRRRLGIEFFWAQSGEALAAVETVASHLSEQLEQRDRILRSLKRERELERSALHAKLSALQAQVEPHFLFNTLGNLRYLIRTDADAAQQMLDHLVGYLQNALPDMRSVSSTLGRELDLARNYLSIMQIRMGQRLRFQIQADEALLFQPFPPAMLISLVENAVKHGLERASRPGEIVISASSSAGILRVQVQDDGIGLSGESGQGFGLANIHERLHLLYGERGALAVAASPQGGVEAVLSVPLAAIKE